MDWRVAPDRDLGRGPNEAQPAPAGPRPLRLVVEPLEAGWELRLDGAAPLRVEQAGRRHPLPRSLDGPALAALPLALRARRPLHVEGRLSRAAARNLRELAEAWNAWDEGRFAAVPVTSQGVADDEAPAAAPGGVAAWSADLRSTHLLTGGDEALGAAGLGLRAAVHVLGLGAPTPAPGDLARAAEAFGTLGIELVVVRTNAAAAGWIDPVTGAWPVVAAALRLVGDGAAPFAAHARTLPMRAQLLRPRPEPTLPDAFGGDALPVWALGGVASAPAMARRLALDPRRAALLAGCRATGLAPPRCGRCPDCALIDLGAEAAGLPTGALGPGAAPPLPFAPDTPAAEAEAALAVRDWSGRALGRLRLAGRLLAAERARARAARAAWRDAMAGTGQPWPR